jgi:hypothetical protein
VLPYKNAKDRSRKQLAKPEYLVSSLLGHEGKGSILSYLKDEKGWVTSVGAAPFDGTQGKRRAFKAVCEGVCVFACYILYTRQPAWLYVLIPECLNSRICMYCMSEYVYMYIYIYIYMYILYIWTHTSPYFDVSIHVHIQCTDKEKATWLTTASIEPREITNSMYVRFVWLRFLHFWRGDRTYGGGPETSRGDYCGILSVSYVCVASLHRYVYAKGWIVFFSWRLRRAWSLAGTLSVSCVSVCLHSFTLVVYLHGSPLFTRPQSSNIVCKFVCKFK